MMQGWVTHKAQCKAAGESKGGTPIADGQLAGRAMCMTITLHDSKDPAHLQKFVDITERTRVWSVAVDFDSQTQHILMEYQRLLLGGKVTNGGDSNEKGPRGLASPEAALERGVEDLAAGTTTRRRTKASIRTYDTTILSFSPRILQVSLLKLVVRILM